MNQVELKQRTKKFALRVMKRVDALANTKSGRAIGNQLVRAGASVGANDRATCRNLFSADYNRQLPVANRQ